MTALGGIRRVHFVGIGGVGMCGLAELLAAQGFAVSGSDLVAGASVRRLRELGVPVRIGHDAEALEETDVVVVSSAIPADNPEVREATRRHVRVIPRAEMLAWLMDEKDGIAVAGTHGKTTTTSLVAHLLDAAGLDPTAVVGGRVIGASPQRSGTRVGAGSLLVAEADESDGSFLRLAPRIAVITNVEPEHLDYYGSEAALRAAFADFASRVPADGRVVICSEDPGARAIASQIARPLTRYGFSAELGWEATEIHAHPWGTLFEVRHLGTPLGPVRLPLHGRHNVANALAALAVADELEVPFPDCARALAEFGGVERRFERKGQAGGIEVVDDYGHHPTEIRATLAAARSVHTGRIVVVFQPHRFSRTRDFFEDFAASFQDADLVVVTEIYAAGEAKIPGVEAKTLAEAVAAQGHGEVRFVAELGRVVETLTPALRPGDLVVTLGAGDVGRLGPALLGALGEAAP